MSFLTDLTRRTLLHWLGITGAAVALPVLVLPEPFARPPVPPDALSAKIAAYPILITDDELQIIKLYQMGFAMMGWTSIGTLSAVEAITLCRRIPVSLVISDVMKPDVNGFEMLQRMKADSALAHIPVLFISAGASADRHLTALELGAVGYVTKPVMVWELVARVEQALLEHGNWQQPHDFDPALFKALMARDTRRAAQLGLHVETPPEPMDPAVVSRLRAKIARYQPGV
jgi:DNA-binding response OmpR family regulator